MLLGEFYEERMGFEMLLQDSFIVVCAIAACFGEDANHLCSGDCHLIILGRIVMIIHGRASRVVMRKFHGCFFLRSND